jgi:hypothetical protein
MPEEKVPTVSGSKNRRYTCPPGDNLRIIADVKRRLESQDIDAQHMNTDGQGLLFQIKKRGGWRDFVGVATSLNIVFHQFGDTLTVQIGAGKWVARPPWAPSASSSCGPWR